MNNWVIAKTEDGTIQITYTVAYSEIEKARESALAELSGNVTVPGFRKGKAPLSKVTESVSKETVIEKSLSKIIPTLLSETIKKEKLRIAIYPKFDLISANDDKPWEIRATTCEVPTLTLGDYKKELKKNKKKDMAPEEKEQVAIMALISTSKVKIPKILLEEEVNARLSKLLSRLEKLGLSLEQYLASIGKTADSLRVEYENQSKQALIVDLSLLTLAETQNLKVSDAEITSAIKATETGAHAGHNHDDKEERSLVGTVLLKKKALDQLISLL